jgi:hypothetical protein
MTVLNLDSSPDPIPLLDFDPILREDVAPSSWRLAKEGAAETIWASTVNDP